MQYVYPCLITQLFSETTPTAGYVATLPDFENQMVYGDNMFSVISEAQRALAIKLYYAETESNGIPEPSEYKTFELESNQYLSFITCDTENFATIFDLYEQLKTEDLITYLQDKDNTLKNDILPNVSMTPLKRKSNKNAKIDSQVNLDIDFSEIMGPENQNIEKDKAKEKATEIIVDKPEETESKLYTESQSTLIPEYDSETKSEIHKSNESGLITGFKSKKKHKKHKDKQQKTEIKPDLPVKPEPIKTEIVKTEAVKTEVSQTGSVNTENNKNIVSEKQESLTKEVPKSPPKNDEQQHKTIDDPVKSLPVNQLRREPPKKYSGDKKKEEKKVSDKASETKPIESTKINSLNLNKQEKDNRKPNTSDISDKITEKTSKPNARPGVTLQRPRQGAKKS